MSAEDGLGRIRSMGIIAWSSIGTIVLLGIVLFVLFSIRAVLMPFFYALVFVYVLRPMVDYLDNKGLPRTISLILSYLVLAMVIVLFGTYVGPILFREGNALVKQLPGYVVTANGYINDIIISYPFLRGEQATEILTDLGNSFKLFLEQVARSIPMFTASLFGSVFNLILAPIIAFYVLKDLKVIRETIKETIPRKHRAEGMQIIRKMDCVVGGFLKGQMLVALSVAVLSGVALSVLGVEYAILLGVLIGIFNIIPYLGPIIGGAPAVIIALGTSWKLALLVVVVLLIVQQLDSVLISPRIMSQQVNLHPVVVMFALLVGGTLFGIVGMLIAIPIAAVGKAIYVHFKERNSSVGPGEPDVCELQPTAKV